MSTQHRLQISGAGTLPEIPGRASGRLCRYLVRPPLALEGLTKSAGGQSHHPGPGVLVYMMAQDQAAPKPPAGSRLRMRFRGSTTRPT